MKASSPAMTDLAPCCGGDRGVSQSQPCADGERAARPEAEPSAADTETEFQRFADARVAPEYRQPLKTIDEALAAIGWAIEDRPSCCGEPVHVQAFLGCADLAECERCGKFVARVNAPQFGNAWVDLPTIEEPESGRVWIAGVRESRS